MECNNVKAIELERKHSYEDSSSSSKESCDPTDEQNSQRKMSEDV